MSFTSEHQNGLHPPGSPDSERFSPSRPGQPRRMTASSGRTPPPPGPLGLPEPADAPPKPHHRDSRPRSRSPLRSSHSYDDGGSTSASEDDHFEDAMSSARHSTATGSIANVPPISSKVASAFLRVGSLVGSSIHSAASEDPHPMTPTTPWTRSPRLTDAELEAEALREKENSRLEAEKILIQEAKERRKVEERVLSMLKTTNGGADRPPGSPKQSPVDSLPTPTTPRREDSNGGGGWMTGLMKKLTPTKDLTPAQQIINETKARERERDKERRQMEKQRSREWPAAPQAKLNDPTFLSLGQSTAVTSPSASPASRLAPSSYSGVSPLRSQTAPNGALLGYSPSTPTPASRVHGPAGGSPLLGASPGEPTPLYAVFNQSGTLDIPATLITVTRRFEKLEKWTVSHVRALEDRMKDVEKYLIEREGGGDKSSDIALRAELSVLTMELARVHVLIEGLRSDLTDSQNGLGPSATRAQPVSQARSEPLVQSPIPMSATGAPTNTEPVTMQGTGSSSIKIPRSLPQVPQGTPSAFSGRSVNPPARVEPPPTPKSPPPLHNKASRTRLPYPSGDYTSTSSGFSSSQSRPGSPTSVSGLASPPRMDLSESYNSQSLHDRSGSDSSYVIPERLQSPTPPHSASELAPPRTPNAAGQTRAASKSPSPTPRKRYTVALSGRDDGRIPSPNNATRGEGEMQTALFSDSPNGGSRAHSPVEKFESGYGAFGLGGGHKHGRETSDATAVPDRENTQSPDPTIGFTPITLSRLPSSPPPSAGMGASPGNGSAVGMSPKGRPRPTSTYSLQSLSPSLKSVNTGTTTPQTNGTRMPSLRARAQSTYFANETSGSPQASPSPAGGVKPLNTSGTGPHPHRRAQSIGLGLGVGVGVRSTPNVNAMDDSASEASPPRVSNFAAKRGSTLITPSGQPFVDPLVIKKKSRDFTRGATSPNGLKSPTGTKIPFGQLVAFFDGAEK